MKTHIFQVNKITYSIIGEKPKKIIQITRENTLKGLRLRIMLWIALLSKSIAKYKETNSSYPHSNIRYKMVESIVLLLNYMKEIVDELEDKNVLKVSSYDWQKHIKLTWSGEDQTCKVDIGAFTVQQQNEYLGANRRFCLLYPLAEKVFINISSSLREKSGIVVRSHSTFDVSSEVFEEFANLCATPMQKLFCHANLSLKQALQYVNASALSGVWLLFESFEHLPPILLATLSKEIQMVQQQFIIAELAQDQQAEGQESGEGSSNQMKESENKQNVAVIEHSRSSLQIKRKKTHKENSKMEAEESAKGPKTKADPKLQLLSKTCFGIFATVSNDYLLQHCNEDVLNKLKGAFRITSITYIPPEVYILSLLKAKNFHEHRKLGKSMLGFYSKISTYSSCRTISLREVYQVVTLAEKIRNLMIFSEKDLHSDCQKLNKKAIARFESNKQILSVDSILNSKSSDEWIIKIEREALGEAVFLFEKCRIPHAISPENWGKIIQQISKENNIICSEPYKAIERVDAISQGNRSCNSNSSLMMIAKESAEGLKYAASDFVVYKVIELYEMCLTRSHICLCGVAGSGKSSIFSILCTFLYRLQGQIVKKHMLNFSAETPDQLFGVNKREACILNSIRQDIKEQPNCRPCFFFDSDTDSSWMDLFVSGKQIHLAEHTINFPANTLFLYETLALANVSPKILSQIAVAYIATDIITPLMIVNTSINALYEKHTEFFASVFISKEIVEQTLKPIFGHILEIVLKSKLCEMWTIQSCLRITFKILNSFCQFLTGMSKSNVTAQDTQRLNSLILSSQVI